MTKRYKLVTVAVPEEALGLGGEPVLQYKTNDDEFVTVEIVNMGNSSRWTSEKQVQKLINKYESTLSI